MPFWKSGVLCQHSEDVLWEWLYMQVIFQYICEGEYILPILFFCHLEGPLDHMVFIFQLKKFFLNIYFFY